MTKFNKGDRIRVVLICEGSDAVDMMWSVEGDGYDFYLAPDRLSSAERLPPKWEPEVGNWVRYHPRPEIQSPNIGLIQFKGRCGMNDAQIKHMVDRFLMWRLPESFSPDGGISFKPTFNDSAPTGPMRHEPTGTNLLDAIQATAMVRHMIEGLPAPSPSPDVRGLIERLESDSMDAICEVVGAPREVNEGKEVMRQWFLDQLRKRLATPTASPVGEVGRRYTARDNFLALTDQSNWGDMKGDYLKGYSDAMEQVHQDVMDFWPELDFEAPHDRSATPSTACPRPQAVTGGEAKAVAWAWRNDEAKPWNFSAEDPHEWAKIRRGKPRYIRPLGDLHPPEGDVRKLREAITEALEHLAECRNMEAPVSKAQLCLDAALSPDQKLSEAK